MKIRSERDKRNYIIVALCAILVVMGVGYATFSSLLTINGTASTSNSWCLGFDNTKTNAYEITKGISTGEAPSGSMAYTGTACGSNLVPHADLSATFHQPGDQIEYTLTIKNASTVTAAIKSILVDSESVSTNTTKKKGNIIYIINMPADTTLSPNEETTMTVVAKVQNDTDITGTYTGGETQTINVGINTEQDDGNGGMDTTFTGTIYRHNAQTIMNGFAMAGKWCGIGAINSCDYGIIFQSEASCRQFIQYGIANNVTIYGDLSEYTCTESSTKREITYTKDASTLNANYYLKHDVVEDIVTNSYVCFVYNNAEHCMKGGEFETNTQIIKDYQTFNNLGDYDYSTDTGCNFISSYSTCYGGDFYRINVRSDGFVIVNGSSSEDCRVTSDGGSACNE